MKEDFEDLHIIHETQEYTRSYDTRYVAEIQHLGLGTYRILKDLDFLILDNKVEAQFRKWDEQWAKVVNKNQTQAHKEANLNIAEERTREAQIAQKEIEELLLATLEIDDTVNWDSLKDRKKFKVPNPKNFLQKELEKLIPPSAPSFRQIPAKPDKAPFQPSFSLVDKIFKSLKEKKIAQSEELYQSSLAVWKVGVEETNNFNKRLQDEFQQKLIDIDKLKNTIITRYEELEAEWKEQEVEFYTSQNEHNLKIDKLKESYFQGEAEAILQYCELVLNNSIYPDSFPKDFELDYNPITKILLVDYILPAPEQLPTLTEVKYIAAKKELKESHISESQLAKNYDTSIYNITLRTIHELFEADQANGIDVVIFNGWVQAINKGTGKKTTNCIVSIQAKKTEFIDIELANVDPKACFKNLKGIGSSKLSGITAIQPILQINKNDKRFVSSYDVADKVNAGDNLASMPWEDFEHLIREIFSKEFSANGGEVKVTQASRDGGVDAIAFDPDPIRGGKIVIQAKRYTNTVGVSSVRDLYGTVMNEGATKGILVTTADYGPDAYDFVKNKPLTLMNGANLLYLLEKHGHLARIDLAEAKRLMS
jgi:restriction system protein